jgi:hypothetical protein
VFIFAILKDLSSVTQYAGTVDMTYAISGRLPIQLNRREAGGSRITATTGGVAADQIAKPIWSGEGLNRQVLACAFA